MNRGEAGVQLYVLHSSRVQKEGGKKKEKKIVVNCRHLKCIQQLQGVKRRNISVSLDQISTVCCIARFHNFFFFFEKIDCFQHTRTVSVCDGI